MSSHQSAVLNWTSDTSDLSIHFLEQAKNEGRPVILLLGAGISADSGFPLASQIKEYLVQVREFVSREGFSNVRQYIEECRWPSRHDLRVDLMLQSTDVKRVPQLQIETEMVNAERKATQAALISELRRSAPTLALSLQEIFGQLDHTLYNQTELSTLYNEVRHFAEALGRRSPKNIAYRSLLFQLCDNNQATIDACFDHFIRDRTPTTTHQFVYFLTRILRIPVIFTTNFDPLLEMAFSGEGLVPRVYEVQGEGSIPSARLLLSQPLSIVKLHGGAHHMQTGFDLDDPLSPAALSSFTDLFEQLKKRYHRSPLTVVIGYSGSDRRVMDIIAGRIREWETAPNGGSSPNVLWVCRDPWEPDLLKSAVNTHPNVIQRGLTSKTSKDNYQFPAHLIRYRDGRLFLLETLQSLSGHFPIARSNYQAVNFVPHSVAGKSRSSENAAFFEKDWRIALIKTMPGGGSSSTLVAVAENLERKDYKTIWIDLTEVAGVPALIDLVSERITKLDGRLQPVRRPPLLRSLLNNNDQLDDSIFASASREHEFLSCIQWLRLALRRGKYTLALDSLEEFPSEHPALELGNRKSQRELMCELIRVLADDPTLIGDSKIAIALSIPNAVSQHESGDGHHVFRELAAYLSRLESTHPVLVPPLKSEHPQNTDYQAAFEKVGMNKDKEVALARVVTLLVSVCARRIRSQVLLRKCSAEYMARVKGQVDAPFITKLNERTKLFTANPAGEGKSELNAFERLWNDASLEQQQRNEESDEIDEKVICKTINEFTRYESQGEPIFIDDRGERQWLYRTEGGYHWMHRDVRDGLYVNLRDGKNYAALAMAHHVIALFCYDELYERSRDARAFLEYLFHRIATIKIAIEAGQFQCASNWITRLLIALHREKHALLTRVRLPGFIWQLMQLQEVMTQWESILPKGEKYEHRVKEQLVDLLRLLVDFFLASGHPHSAFSDALKLFSRVFPFKTPPARACSNVAHHWEMTKFIDVLKFNDETKTQINQIITLRDVAYSGHDPLLSTLSFPRMPSSSDSFDHCVDWIDRMAGGDANNSRTTRIRLCKSIYEVISSVRQKILPASKELRHWTEYDLEMDTLGGVIRKSLEFEYLLNHSSAWIESSKVYLDRNPRAIEAISAFCKKTQSLKGSEPWSVADEEIKGDNPLLRRSGKRQRHECYRLCLKARAEAADFLYVTGDEGGDFKVLKEHAQWRKIQRRLTDAESILNRSGGPAERQAMAITRLISAELFVRKAEVLQWGADREKNSNVTQKESATRRSLLELAAEKALDESFATLSTVEILMNEGRGENRWRFFYLLTLGRAHLLRAFIRHHEGARQSCLTDMTWAARHLTGAFNNCGIWTDRYDVLLWWWDTWKEVARRIHADAPDGESAYRSYISFMYARLGIRWGAERFASRADRDNG